MKAMRRTFIFAVVVILVMSVVAFPVFAIGTPYSTHISGFVELYNGSPANAYIRAAQAFLYHYPYTQATIINGGGIDGGYGNATENAVKIYQQKKWPYSSAEWDGRVGSKTWGKIAGDLSLGSFESGGFFLCYNSGNVMFVDRSSGFTYYSCTAGGLKDRYIESNPG